MQVEQVVGQGPGALPPGQARPHQWYLLSPAAAAGPAALPEPRVGHTASYLPHRKKVSRFARFARPD